VDSPRIYRHFCMMARSLEVVGERWSLLIVRDLLFEPRRFTDLMGSLANIAPARLTDGLRRLERAGIVIREPMTAGREVWYRLSEAGRELMPVVEALTLWGINHELQSPRADEPVHPAAVMIGTKVFVTAHADGPRSPVTWVWRFPAEGDFTLRHEQGDWILSRGAPESADVVIEASLRAWARFLTARGARKLPRRDIRMVGKAEAVQPFARAFAAELRSR
jgi:DNA-binding HxlR family transcriptional regulator